MDLKQEAARAAYTSITDNSSVGLGDGTAMIWLAGQVIDGIRKGLNLSVFTSSFKTRDFLKEAGIAVSDISLTDYLDQYFDGCDQIDADLNVFKSGSGIHTSEKLLASMAKKFIILADGSKFVSKLNSHFPLVLEVLPQSTRFVMKEVKKIFREVFLCMRVVDRPDNPVITRYGNYLIDCRFTELPQLEFIQNKCKNISGVIEISLFYKMAHEAIIADNEGIRRYERKYNTVILTRHDPL